MFCQLLSVIWHFHQVLGSCSWRFFHHTCTSAIFSPLYTSRFFLPRHVQVFLLPYPTQGWSFSASPYINGFSASFGTCIFSAAPYTTVLSASPFKNLIVFLHHFVQVCRFFASTCTSGYSVSLYTSLFFSVSPCTCLFFLTIYKS